MAARINHKQFQMARISAANRCVDAVYAFAKAFHHDVFHVVDGLDIVAVAAAHNVFARSAIQPVNASTANEDIVIALVD